MNFGQNEDFSSSFHFAGDSVSKMGLIVIADKQSKRIKNLQTMLLPVMNPAVADGSNKVHKIYVEPDPVVKHT